MARCCIHHVFVLNVGSYLVDRVYSLNHLQYAAVLPVVVLCCLHHHLFTISIILWDLLIHDTVARRPKMTMHHFLAISQLAPYQICTVY